MNGYFKIKGKSGQEYTFSVYDINANLGNKGGVYIFGKHTIPNNIKLIYCGKTHDFSERFERHHKKDEILKHHPNILGILHEEKENMRVKIETDILEGNNFLCNDQHN